MFKTYLSSLILSLVLQSSKTLPKPIYTPQLSYAKLKIYKSSKILEAFRNTTNQEINDY